MLQRKLTIYSLNNQLITEIIYSNAVIKPGDMVIELENQDVFICKQNNEETDHLIGTDNKVYHTNQDPHHCYKIEKIDNTIKVIK